MKFAKGYRIWEKYELSSDLKSPKVEKNSKIGLGSLNCAHFCFWWIRSCLNQQVDGHLLWHRGDTMTNGESSTLPPCYLCSPLVFTNAKGICAHWTLPSLNSWSVHPHSIVGVNLLAGEQVQEVAAILRLQEDFLRTWWFKFRKC